MNEDKKINIYSSLLAILAGLLFGLVIMFITNPGEAIFAFITIITGGFNEGIISVGKVFFRATPIILTGLSVGFAFKTGLFNIGAAGQVLLGAFFAVYIGVKWTFLGPSQWIVALLFAGIGGAIWALIPGLLKAYRNVHEVVSTIMFNYIGLFLVLYLVETNIYNQAKNESFYVHENAVIPNNLFNLIFGEKTVNWGFFIAIGVVIIVNFILNKTTFGYQLKAVGLNKDASIYAGINARRNIIYSMLIAGFLSGLAGGLIYLNNIDRAIEVVTVLNPEGFMGIPVALIGLSNPYGILLAALFISYMSLGGFYMQIYAFTPEIIDIIIAAIIYFSALVILFKSFITILKKGNRRMSKQ